MYCPTCGTNNLDGARYCRSCGVDISLVPQALTGRLPQQEPPPAPVPEGRRGRRERGEPSLDKAVKSIFMGVGFLVVAIVLAFMPMGRAWWFWMFIPAFTMLGGGVAEWMRVKQTQPQQPALPRASMQPQMPPPPARAQEPQLPRRNTAELIMQPPSVTEGTTRHLGAEAPTRHMGRAVENPSSKRQTDA
ncbi:MAG TPA: zinc ribbon domain-containing protein [Pyrinomonadaceae bacterium]